MPKRTAIAAPAWLACTAPGLVRASEGPAAQPADESISIVYAVNADAYNLWLSSGDDQDALLAAVFSQWAYNCGTVAYAAPSPDDQAYYFARLPSSLGTPSTTPWLITGPTRPGAPTGWRAASSSSPSPPMAPR